MKISNSTITMQSSSVKHTESRTSENLKAWIGNRTSAQNLKNEEEKADFREALKKLRQETRYEALDQASHVENFDEEYLTLSEEDKNKIKLFNKLLEALIGKKLKTYVADKIILRRNPASQPALVQQATPVQSTPLKGWGMIFTRNEYYSETEAMSFQSTGNVTTSDGRTIQFDLSLNVSRSFVQESNLTVKAGDALVDPLVINYDQPSATLSTAKYEFDLDLDEKNDQISFAKSGSGFLVYDKNGDGKIGNGSEMFGPQTGDGFLELAQFDTDGNNWIDENDPIFDKLQIWTKDENGQDQLFAIGRKGIGAIYLGNVSSQFSLMDAGNDTLGEIRQTGIFLREDGSAGTIQHIDISL